jgi:hypothetical protein
MKNRNTKYRKIELTTAQIAAVKSALTYTAEKSNPAQADSELWTLTRLFSTWVEDVVVTIADD